MNKWTNSAKIRLVAINQQEIKATDLDVIVSQIMKLPYGQLKKILTAEILEILEKYGYKEGK